MRIYRSLALPLTALLLTTGTALARPAGGPGGGPPDHVTPGRPDPSTVTLQTFETRIPASMPDDHGNPVTLDAEVIVPDAVCPCPGIVWNHGFGGNKGNARTTREMLARNGYVLLSYTSRGFGTTPGQVDLMGVKEQQDLLDAVDWLIAPDNAVVQGAVIPDAIGQIGASYGGFHAWSLARSGHPAVKTVVTIATATDLYEAIAPYDVEMLTWVNGFYATGYRPEKDNYSQTFHRVVAELNTGINNQDVRTELQARAMKRRWSNVRIPVFIIQGINDGLFPANQAIEAYEELTARGVETRLYLGGIGHPPAVANGPEVDHVYEQAIQWFDWHLKGDRSVPISREPSIEVADAGYFKSVWDGTVRKADELAEPVRTFHLCATSPLGGSLSTEPCSGASPVPMANTFGGSGYADEPVTGDYMRDEGIPITDTSQLPSVVRFESAPFAAGATLDLGGIPRFDLQVASAHQLPVGARGAVAAFQLDPKIWDVAPDGSAKLITRGAFSEQVNAAAPGTSPIHQVSFDAFAAFYQIREGHRLRVTLATEDTPYLRPTTHPFGVTIFPGSTVSFATGDWLSEPEPVGAEPGQPFSR